jgi:hypothetical protein
MVENELLKVHFRVFSRPRETSFALIALLALISLLSLLSLLLSPCFPIPMVLSYPYLLCFNK